MADDLRNQTCLKDGLLDSGVGSCDLFGVLMVTSERSGAAAQEAALASCALGMLAAYYTRTLIFIVLELLCLWQGCMWSSSPFGSGN